MKNPTEYDGVRQQSVGSPSGLPVETIFQIAANA
jgi:hypothetical protein